MKTALSASIRLMFATIIGTVILSTPRESRSMEVPDTCGTAATAEVGVIFPAVVDHPAPIPVNGGIGYGTFVIANLGDKPFSPALLTPRVEVISTNAPGPFEVRVFNQYSNFVLRPGESAGHIGIAGGGPATFDLPFVQSVFPEVTSLYGPNLGHFEAGFSNQSTVPFNNTETLLAFMLDGASEGFYTKLLTHDPQIGPNTMIHAGSARLSVAIPPLTCIDVRPGSFENRINLKSRGKIPVAILTTETFDATSVDPLSVRFGPNGIQAGPESYSFQDADGDGDIDVVINFKIQESIFQCGDAWASIMGNTVNGQQIAGTDSIKTLGCK